MDAVIEPYLNGFALFLLIAIGIGGVYLTIYIHDIPYEIARKRNHPHQDAFHAAGWVSLFLMHSIWPILWIWAFWYKDDAPTRVKVEMAGEPDEVKELETQIADLQKQLDSAKKENVKQENTKKQ